MSFLSGMMGGSTSVGGGAGSSSGGFSSMGGTSSSQKSDPWAWQKWSWKGQEQQPTSTIGTIGKAKNLFSDFMAAREQRNAMRQPVQSPMLGNWNQYPAYEAPLENYQPTAGSWQEDMYNPYYIPQQNTQMSNLYGQQSAYRTPWSSMV